MIWLSKQTWLNAGKAVSEYRDSFHVYIVFFLQDINITYQVFNFVCSAGRYLFNVENKTKGMSPNLVFNMNRIQANWSSFIPHEIVRKPRLNPFIIRSEI